MAKYMMFAFTNPIEGREAEYNDRYDNSDGVYNRRAQAALGNFFDIERVAVMNYQRPVYSVEILRSTTYGGEALAPIGALPLDAVEVLGDRLRPVARLGRGSRSPLPEAR